MKICIVDNIGDTYKRQVQDIRNECMDIRKNRETLCLRSVFVTIVFMLL